MTAPYLVPIYLSIAAPAIPHFVLFWTPEPLYTAKPTVFAMNRTPRTLSLRYTVDLLLLQLNNGYTVRSGPDKGIDLYNNVSPVRLRSGRRHNFT